LYAGRPFCKILLFFARLRVCPCAPASVRGYWVLEGRDGEVKKRVEQLMRQAEGALGKAFQQLDYAGGIARKLEAFVARPRPEETFVELMIVREVMDRVERICNAAFIADARAAGPLPFPPRYPVGGMAPPTHRSSSKRHPAKGRGRSSRRGK